MADEPISGLTETTSVTGNEFIPIVQSGVTKKIKQINLVPNQSSFSGTILFDSDITLSSGYIYLEKNTNSGSRSLTIPSATGNTGKFIFVAKQYNNGYNIVCSGGGISSTLTRSNDSVLYICDGSSWQPHLNISNELLLAISGKEPTITAGTTSQYWRGDKTWQTFPTISTPSLDEVTDVGNTTTNDITVGSATLSNTTVSTLPFINTAKKIISATGALLGTWFQTLTAKSTPVDADTIVVNDSTASFEAKKTTLLQLWTNYIKGKADALYATIASLSNYVDLTNPQTISGQKTFSRNTGNSQTGTGTGTVITNLDCQNFIGSGRTYMNVTGEAVVLGANSGHNNKFYTTIVGANSGNWSMTGQHNTLIGYANAPSLSTGGIVTAVGSNAVNQLTTGSYIVALGLGAGYNITTASNCVYLGTNSGRSLGNQSNRLAIDSDTNIGKSFPFIYGEFDNSILAFNVNRVGIGVQNPNARAVLHTQSTSRGFLPPVLTTAQRDAVSWVAGDAGMMIYNSTTNKHQGWNGTTWNDMY